MTKPIIKKTAFCATRTCCPTWELDPETNIVTVKDDFDGSVTMSLEQWKSLVNQANEVDLISQAAIAHSLISTDGEVFIKG
jgi:hypothetical protein